MTAFPDFTAHGYQVIKELGHNSEGGRFTYLAKQLADNVQVVIKQFQFSKGAGWDGFGAIEREIQSLQGLNHRGIPKYLDKFETDNGYCLVTEYFPADTLAVGRSFTPDQIKQIAVQILEILVYLQERMPPVIHRDVKPENILVDENLNVYLIDFGFARVGSGSVAMSSANAGTFGFMAPEQIRNLKLTNASDLYGLGLTLICLIGAIRSTDIGNYIDFSNQLDRSKIDSKLKGCSLTFVKWLDQMVAPDPSKRFADAKVALDALKPLYVVRLPSVKFSKSNFIFETTKSGGKITQNIIVKNPTPETVLDGKWEVISSSANSSSDCSWISVSPQKFTSNEVVCEVTVDTSELIKESSGNYSIILHTNAVPDSYTFPLKYTLIYSSIEISNSNLEFKATNLGEKITQTIIISNSFPKAVLEGYWEVAPHLNDPPHTPDSHGWITFSSKQFKGNKIECQITVDTSKLFAESSGKRTIILHSNTLQEAHTLTVNIVTATLPQEAKVSPCSATLTYLITSIFLGYLVMLVPSFSPPNYLPLSNVDKYINSSSDSINFIMFIALPFGLISSVMSWLGDYLANMERRLNNSTSTIFVLITGGIIGATILVALVTNSAPSWVVIVALLIVGFIGTMVGKFINYPLHNYLELPENRRYSNIFLNFLLYLAIICGIGLGACLKLGLLIKPYLLISYVLLISITLTALILLAVILTFTLIIPPLQHGRKIAAYRRKTAYLIKL